jgi:sugar lactone lactonase YvrE
LSDVTAVYVDSSTHNIYITSAEGVLRITPARNIERVFPVAATIKYLTGDNLGNLYFAKIDSSTIYRYDLIGLPEKIVGRSLPIATGEPFEDGSNALSAHLGDPSGLWFDTQANRLYFADSGSNIIGVYDPVSKTVSRVGGQFNKNGGYGYDLGNEYGDNGPARDGFLLAPKGIWGDRNHNIFIVDSGHGLREIISANRRRALSAPINETGRIYLRGSSQE